MDRHDVRVVEASDEPRLLHESVDQVRPALEPFAQHLDRHAAARGSMGGGVDLGHAAGTNQGFEMIVGMLQGCGGIGGGTAAVSNRRGRSPGRRQVVGSLLVGPAVDEQFSRLGQPAANAALGSSERRGNFIGGQILQPQLHGLPLDWFQLRLEPTQFVGGHDNVGNRWFSVGKLLRAKSGRRATRRPRVAASVLPAR